MNQTYNDLESINCPLCSSTDHVLLFKGRDRLLYPNLVRPNEFFGVTKCRNCQFIFTSPRVPGNRIYEYYPDTYYPDEVEYSVQTRLNYGELNCKSRLVQKDIFTRIHGFNSIFSEGPISSFTDVILKLFSLIRQFRINPINFNGEGKYLLDIGCGSGKYLSQQKTLNWNVKGIENSSKAVAICNKANLDVINGDFLESDIKETFHVIHLNQVLEHLYNPRAVIKKIYSLMKPGGALILTFPNIRSLVSRVYKQYWFNLDLPRHVNFFHRKSIKGFLKEEGFSVVDNYCISSTRGITGLFF